MDSGVCGGVYWLEILVNADGYVEWWWLYCSCASFSLALYFRKTGLRTSTKLWQESALVKKSWNSFFIVSEFSIINPLPMTFGTSPWRFSGSHRSEQLSCFMCSLVTNRMNLILKLRNFLPPGLWNRDAVILGSWAVFLSWKRH